jgi:hypothetical protein
MKSDKMQMSYVPQTSEHVLISSNTVKDIDILPYGAIVEDIGSSYRIGSATGAEIDLGTTASANYYKATAIAC